MRAPGELCKILCYGLSRPPGPPYEDETEHLPVRVGIRAGDFTRASPPRAAPPPRRQSVPRPADRAHRTLRLGPLQRAGDLPHGHRGGRRDRDVRGALDPDLLARQALGRPLSIDSRADATTLFE